ncbi:hypothetical protein D3C77_297320 [compost metagenome]
MAHATGGDHHVLLPCSGRLVDQRGRHSAHRQARFPHLLACCRVECTQVVVLGTGKEHQAGRRRGWTAECRHTQRDRHFRLDTQRSGVLDGSQRNLPDQLLRIQVNRTHAAERWVVARHAQWRLQNVDSDTTIDASDLRTNSPHETRHFISRHFEFLGVFLGDQGHSQRHTHVIDEHHAGVLVDGDATPVHATQQAGPFDVWLFSRRREWTHIDRVLEHDPAVQLVEGAHTPHRRFSQWFGTNDRHTHGVRLRRRQVLAFCRWRGRHRTFLNFGNRFAGTAIQHKDMTGLGGLDQDRGFLALGVLHVIKNRLRRQIVVPHIVVDHLVDPFGLACRSVDGDDCRAVLFLDLVTITAPIVRRAVAGWQVYQVQRFVVGRNGPDVRRFERELIIGGGSICPLGRAYIPGPHQRTGQHIEGAHSARGLVCHDIAHPATHDRQVAHDHRQRGWVIAFAVLCRAHAFLEIDIAVVAKARAKVTGMRIEREQTGIHRRHQNALAALLLIAVSGLDLGAEAVVLVDVVITDAAARNVLFASSLRIELPEGLAGVTIERGDQVFRRARVQNTADLQRGVFVHACACASGSAARSVRPGNLQLVNVFRGDLRVGRKPCSRRIAAKELPVFRRRRLRLGCGRTGCGNRVGDRTVREKRRNEGGDQPQEHGKTRTVSQALRAQRRASKRCANPQTERQDNGRDDQARKQLPVTELAYFVERPDASGQEYNDRQRKATSFLEQIKCGQQQISQARDQVIT